MTTYYLIPWHAGRPALSVRRPKYRPARKTTEKVLTIAGFREVVVDEPESIHMDMYGFRVSKYPKAEPLRRAIVGSPRTPVVVTEADAARIETLQAEQTALNRRMTDLLVEALQRGRPVAIGDCENAEAALKEAQPCPSST
jgi:hypothetical protein